MGDEGYAPTLETMKQATETVVYLLKPETAQRYNIAAGSGIVGEASEADRITVWYEGNVYRSEALCGFAEKVRCAYDRMATNYPTIARMSIPADHLIEVGWYNPVLGTVAIDPAHQDAVAAWCDKPWAELAEEMTASGLTHELARAGFGPEITNWNQAIQYAMRHPGHPASRRLLAQAQAKRQS